MTPDVSTAMEEILNRAVETGAVPGAAFVLTGPEGDVREVTAGTLRVGDDDPVTPATIYRLMSMTKAVVSAGALQLVEAGELGLDQKVASIIPEFGEIKVLDGFDGDRPRLRDPSRPATVQQLFTHTSGHGYVFLRPELVRYYEVTGLPDPLSGVRSSLQQPLVADPGTEWNYGISLDWLGLVVAAVSGQDLPAYLTEHVLDPLEMSDTTFAPSDEQRSRLMAIHSRTPDGGLAISELDLPAEPEYWAGGHGLYGTAGDYARFMAALLAGGELNGNRILRPETVDLMFTDHLAGVPLPPDGTVSTMPELSNDVPPLPFTQTFGLGLHVFTEDLPGMRRAGSGDWSGLCNCYYWIDRASGVAGAFLTQVVPFYDAQILEPLLGTEMGVYAEILAASQPPA
ncbi:MAG TPA: serine hydrolase domain-containing protein [Solirubrobacteraceae bacterium]|nr:serine hydrolase domain-containing protein [Solirubrobacteraceae bacterium]